MQNAKDTFYEMLRGRLASLNPERTVVIRGATRPGLIVNENEAVGAAVLPDVFHVQWMDCELDARGPMPLVTMTAELVYATAGSSLGGGLDRGRALAAMDGELLAAVRQCPQNVMKSAYAELANGGAASPMGTRVWWGDPVFGAAKIERDRIVRTATVAVMSYEEAGEL